MDTQPAPPSTQAENSSPNPPALPEAGRESREEGVELLVPKEAGPEEEQGLTPPSSKSL